MDGISVIICCYNSADRLPQTLAHLASQKFSQKISWEIIVVDNASTDHTSAVARNCWEEQGSPVPLKVVTEPQMGLTNARNRGVTEAKYEILIFCDDDNGLSESYMNIAWEILNTDRNIGALGGNGYSSTLPLWLMDFMNYYALGPQGTHSGEVTYTQGCLYGAGLVIRKSSLKTIKQKEFSSIMSDRIGKSLISAGDTELTFAIRLAGFKLWYDSRLTFEHFIPASRFTVSYFARLVFYIGYSWMALLPYHQRINKLKEKFPSPSWVDMMYILKRLLMSLMMSIFFTVIFKLKHSRRQVVQLIFQSGELYFTLKNFQVYKKPLKFLATIK